MTRSATCCFVWPNDRAGRGAGHPIPGGGCGRRFTWHRDKGGLEAALARPWATFAGEDLYPDPITKAAALFESIIKNHPFVDGNKRAGYTLGRLTLITLGLDLKASDDEEYDMVIHVATGQLDVGGIVAWMKRHVVAAG